MTESPDVTDLAAYQAKDSQQALDAALATVRSYCGWHIAPSQADTVTVWSDDGRTIILESLKVTAVTSVTQDAVLVPASAYTFDTNGVIRAVSGATFGKTSKLTVDFTHGFATMPADAADVILGLAQRSISDTRGMVPRVGAGQSVVVMENYGSQLGEADKAKLAPYTLSAGFA